MNNSVLIVLPDGVGIKNYLYTNIFRKNTLENLILFHNLDQKAIKDVQKTVKIHQEISIPQYKETIQEKFLKELICLSRLKFNSKLVNNKSILTNWNWNQKGFSKKIFYKLINFSTFFTRKYSSILFLEKKYQIFIRKNSFYKKVYGILDSMKPSSIICTHQRGMKMATIFAAANDLNIKNATVIYSWDNLPKARLALKAQKYLVWSEYMKSEMALYYPEIDQQSVIVTGTPQFEFYQDENNIIEKNIFYKTYNLDINKKIICFSGDDEHTSPDDPKYLNDLAISLKENKLDNDFQILLRQCPVDISGRFDEIVNRHSSLIKIANPLWNFNKKESWTTIYPTFEDVKLLVSTVLYSDLVINVGSTMAFDFAMFNKPCIFINYDQIDTINKNWSVKKIYEYQHFKSMNSGNAVIWLNNKEEISQKIKEALLFKNYQQMMSWKETILFDTENASNNILKNII